MRPLVTVVAIVVLVPVLLLGALLMAATAGVSDTMAPASATDLAVQEIPSSMLDIYAAAGAACPGLPWQLLAAIGATTDPGLAGQLDPSTGEVHPAVVGPDLNGQGDEPQVPDPNQPSGWAHTEGPFQILTTTWATFATVAPGDGHAVPDPQSAWDSAFTLAHALCTYLENDGGDVGTALADDDASPPWDQSVTQVALSYGMAEGAGTGSSGTGTTGGNGGGTPGVPTPGTTYSGQVAVVIAAAESQLGVPYVWGGESPGVGFDCSGLIQWAYAQAGISIPRVTYSQATVGVEVPQPWTSNVEPGDLLLMPGDDDGVTTPLGHIGMAIGNGLMIQAPYTGTVVQIDPIPWSDIELVRQVIS